MPHFDVTIANPPYDGGNKGSMLYSYFINESLKITNKYLIAISPADAYISQSSKAKDFRNSVNTYKPELNISSNWDEFKKNATPQSFKCIAVWNKEPNKNFIVNNKEYDTISNIILNEDPYLKEFYNKLSTYIQKNSSLFDYSIANPKNEQYFDKTGKEKMLQEWKDKTTWFTVLPYCIASHYTTFTYKKYSDSLWYGPARQLVPFKSEKYAKNCYLTIHKRDGKKGELNPFYKMIDVLRRCNYLKNHKYKYYPYLDFSKNYTTEELCNVIGIKYNETKINELISCMNF